MIITEKKNLKSNDWFDELAVRLFEKTRESLKIAKSVFAREGMP